MIHPSVLIPIKEEEATKHLIHTIEDLRHKNRQESIDNIMSALSWFLDEVLEEHQASLLVSVLTVEFRQHVQRGEKVSQIMKEHKFEDFSELEEALDGKEYRD